MSQSPNRSPTRRPKGNKRERTRAKLIDAATQIIREKGYEKTSLEEVARRAGVTRGSIYGNFKNRDDLFLAVVETGYTPIVPPFVRGKTFREQMRILGKAVLAAAPERRACAIGALSFQLYALKHEAMRARLARGSEEYFRGAAQQLLQYIPAKELPMAPETFVKVVHALTDGILAIRFFAPDAVPDEVIVAAFEALAGPRPRRKRKGKS